MGFELNNFNELARILDEVRRAIQSLGVEIAKVQFDPQNRRDVERVIHDFERKVDSKVAPYGSNPIVREMITVIKQEFRKDIRRNAEKARSKAPAPQATARLQTPRSALNFSMSDKPVDEPIWRMIHPAIAAVARKKFDDGHFADAVESALKEVNQRVKEHIRAKIGREFDGADLMNRAFSLQNPVIVFGDLSTDNGKSIQLGYMQIFSGSMTGIRNPKAHANIYIDAVRATHHLFLASLLMAKLDEADVPALPLAVPNAPVKSVKESLREKMLLLAAAHEHTGSSGYLMDETIAEKLNAELKEIQKQLLIIEDNGFFSLSKAMGPSYGARLTPAGLAKVEELQEREEGQP